MTSCRGLDAQRSAPSTGRRMTAAAGAGTIPPMFKTLRRVFSFAAPRPGSVRSPRSILVPACVERMEKRELLSVTLVKEQLVGNDPRNVEGVVLTFSEPLDEASAEDLDHYRVGRRTDRRQRSEDDRFDPDDRRNRRGLVRFESAVYDPATLTVTLTAREPFNLLRRFRAIRVLGRNDLGVRSATGEVLDGDRNGQPGKDAIERFTFTRQKRVAYGELDGDNVALAVNGPGRLWVVRKTDEGRVLARGDALRVYLDRTDPASSVLTGKVRGNGNGVAVIDQLVNASTAQVQIAADPSFQIVQAIG